MTVVVLLALLALLDALLAGFRAAAGRDGRIAKYAYYRVALLRAALAGAAVVVANALFVALLVATAADPAAAWRDLSEAGARCVVVFGGFATATLAAMAFWLAPVRELRLLPTLLVLGPLTLIRPLVIAGGLIFAAVQTPTPQVWSAATAAGVTMLMLERELGRPYKRRWRRLLPVVEDRGVRA